MMASIPDSPQSSPFTGRSRRSWFDVPNKPVPLVLATEDSVQESDVETLLLSHFTKPPRLDFGTVKLGKSKSCKLVVRNPEEVDQEVVVERFPSKKGFELDQVQFLVSACDEVQLTIKWLPSKEGNVRELILFKVEGVYRLTAILFGKAEEPPQIRRRAIGVGLKGKRPFSIIQTHKNNLPSSDKSAASHREERHTDRKSPPCKQGLTKTKQKAKSPARKRRSSTPKHKRRSSANQKENTPPISNRVLAGQPSEVDDIKPFSSKPGTDTRRLKPCLPDNENRRVTPPCLPGSPSIQFADEEVTSPDACHVLNESIPLRTTPPCLPDSPSILFVEEDAPLDLPSDVASPPIRFADIDNRRVILTPRTRSMRRSTTYTKISELPDDLPVSSDQCLDSSCEDSKKTILISNNEKNQKHSLRREKTAAQNELTFEVLSNSCSVGYDSGNHYSRTVATTYISRVSHFVSASEAESVEQIDKFVSSTPFAERKPVVVNTDTVTNSSDCEHVEVVNGENAAQQDGSKTEKTSSLTVTKSRPSFSPITVRHTSKRLFSPSKSPNQENSLFRLPASPALKNKENDLSFSEENLSPTLNIPVEKCVQSCNPNQEQTVIWGTNYDTIPLTYPGNPVIGSPRLIRKKEINVKDLPENRREIVGSNYDKSPLKYPGNPASGSPRLIPRNQDKVSDCVSMHHSGADERKKSPRKRIIDEGGVASVKTSQNGQRNKKVPHRYDHISVKETKRPKIEQNPGITHANKLKNDKSVEMKTGERKLTRTEMLRRKAALATMKRVDKSRQSSKPVIKQKPGVARSKLVLIRSANKTALPKHPLPFAAKNMYYDERWIEKQERGFTRWINFILTPQDEQFDGKKPEKISAGNLCIEDKKLLQPPPKLAPSKEQLSFSTYSARRRLNRLRRNACLLFQSDALVTVIQKLETEIEAGRLAIRRDRKLNADLGIKQKVMEMILSYNPLWLRTGLETIYGELLCLQSNTDIYGLSHFVFTRFLGNPDIANEYAHPTVPHLYRDGYDQTLAKFILKKFLILVYFLDQAKQMRLIDHDPCLFCKDADSKSSRELLLLFSRDFLAGEGDITKHLSYLGYTVSHVQTALEEYDYSVSSIAVDLRDGIRLVRAFELLTQKWHLSQHMRVPAISRLQKIHNIQVFFDAICKVGLPVEDIRGGKIDPRDIVDGHREKTLSLLWRFIFHFQVDMILDVKHLKEEIQFLRENLRVRRELAALIDLNSELPKVAKAHSEPDLYFRSERLSLLLKWTQAVCAYYGMQVENFTVSFSDGRCLCYLIHHYHPSLLSLDDVHTLTTQTYQGSDRHTDPDDSQDDSFDGTWTTTFSPSTGKPSIIDELLANERENFKLLYTKVLELGGIPFMLKSSDMSNTIPDEKVVITYVSHLCARLLDLRHEIRAARRIQTAWRNYQIRKHKKMKEVQLVAAIKIQRFVRLFLCRHKRAAQEAATVRIQSWWRGIHCRLSLHLKRQEVEEMRRSRAAACIQAAFKGYIARCQLKKLEQTATKLQACWRGYLLRRELLIMNTAAEIVQQKYRATKSAQQQRVHFLKCRTAVILIQKFWRNYREKKQIQDELKREAVLVLQRRYRAYRCGRQQYLAYHMTRGACITVQSAVRGWISRKAYLHRRTSAIVIQSNLRCHLQQTWYLKIRESAVTIQRRYRNLMIAIDMRSRYMELRRATVIIQSHVKRCLVRKHYLYFRRCCIKVQSYVRMYLNRMKYQRLGAAALIIQHRYRAHRACVIQRQDFRTDRKNVITCQATVRRFLAQRRISKLNSAAVTIQTAYRAHVARQHYLITRKAVVVLQQHVKAFIIGQLEKNRFQQLKASTLILQSHFRCYLAMKQLKRLKGAVRIQSWFRGCILRRQLMKMQKAAVQIQTLYRGHRVRKCASVQRDAAEKIQRWYRKKRIDRQVRSAVLIQSYVRCFLARKKYSIVQQSVVKIQAYIRRSLLQNRYQMMKRAAVVLQTRWRACLLARETRTQYQVMIGAAMTIQAAYRGHRVRREYMQCCRCVVKLQAAVRGWLQSQRYQKMKHSAVVIQQRYRAHSAAKQQQQNYQHVRQSVLLIQSACRGWLARRFVREVRAAVKIQSVFRMYKERGRYQTLRRSVTKIQAVVRGRHTRRETAQKVAAIRAIQCYCRAHLLRKKTRREFLKKHAATLLIQSEWRKHSIRKVNRRRNEAATKIQALFRSYQAARIYQKTRRSAQLLQTHIRAFLKGRAARRLYQKQKAATLILQCAVRQYLAQKQLKTLRAAVKLQSWFRGCRCRRHIARMHEAAVTIQSFYRGNKTRKLLTLQKSSALKIQQWYRKQKHLHKTRSAILIQSVVRSFLAQKKYRTVQNSVKTIQNLVKTYLQRCRYLRLKHAASVLQTRWRACLLARETRTQYQVMIGAAMTIQAAYRGQRVRREYMRCCRCVVKLQAAVRGWLQSQRYQKMKHSAAVIQQRYRAHSAAKQQQQNYQHVRQSVLLIQSACRGWLARRFVREVRAAVKIQSVFRMYKERGRYQTLRRSVTKIQAVVRGRHTRRETAQKVAAIRTIQCYCRAHLLRKKTRREFLKKRAATLLIQSEWRKYSIRKVNRRRNEAATKIQALFRSYQAARIYQKTRRSAQLLQTHIRAFLKGRAARRLYQKQKAATLILQCAVRRYFAQKQLRTLRAAVKLQSWFRGCRCRRHIVRMHEAATTVQSIYRGNKTRKLLTLQKSSALKIQQWYRKQKHLHKTKSAILIQAVIRSFLAQKKYRTLQKSVKTIQNLVKTYLQRCRYLRLKHAASVLQTRWQACLLARETRTQYQVMIGAAMTIQAAYRGHRVRREYMRCCRCVVKLQAAVRGWLQSQRYQKMKHSAAVIQQRYRAHSAAKQQQQNYQHVRQSVLLIQSACRGWLARRFVRQVRAAVKIQSVFRMYKERGRYQTLRRSVTKIQAVVRGRHTRRETAQKVAAIRTIQCYCRAHLLRKKTRREFLKKRAATLLIQSEWRKYSIRKVNRRRNDAAAKIQALFRSYQAARIYQKTRRSAQLLQTHIRAFLKGRAARRLYQKQKAATLILQCAVRQYLAQKQLRAAVKLQSWFRGCRCRRHIVRMHEAAITIQSFYRGNKTRKLLTLQKSSALKIQQWYRKQKHLHKTRSAILIQAVIRSFLAQKKYRTVQNSVKTIQNLVKTYLQRCRYLRLKHAASVLQTRWRACLLARETRTQYQVMIGAAMTIQAAYRGQRVRREYMRCCRCVVKLQAAVRGWLQSQRYQKMKHSAAIIQQRYRAHSAAKQQQQNYQHIRQSVLLIQSACRGWLSRRFVRQVRAAVKIQSVFRMYRERFKFAVMKQHAIKLQAMVKGIIKQKEFKQKVAAARTIQLYYRAHKLRVAVRREYMILRVAVVVIQSHWRRYSVQKWCSMRREGAVKIQAVFRGYTERKKFQSLKAAIQIQAVVRGYLQRRQFTKTRQSVIVLQSYVRRWTTVRSFQVKQKEWKAAVCIQKAYVSYRYRKQQELKRQQRIVFLEQFSQKAHRQMCVVRIQRCLRRHIALQRAKRTLESLLLIQRWVRSRLQRLRYLREVEVQKCQQQAATVIQAWVRRWLVQQRVLRMHQAALTLQSFWRGRNVRKSISNSSLHAARERLQEATKNATEDKKLGNRATSALDFLLRYKQLSYLLDALIHLDAATRLSAVCCEKIVEGNAVEVIYKLIRGCNRSLPHMEIIKYSINVLLNLAKYEKTVDSVYAVPGSVDTLLDLFQIYRDKGGVIFTKSCTLLAILAFNQRRRKEILKIARLTEKLQSIHALTQRKHNMETKRLITKTKLMAAKNYSVIGQSFCTPSKKRLPNVQPEWILGKGKMREIEDPLQAITFVLDVLNITPKVK